MKSSSLFFSARTALARLVAPAFLVGVFWLAAANLAVADNSTNAPAVQASTVQPAAKPEKKPAKKLSGVELYAIHCNRCHPERYPVELDETQWKTIMIHMRVRANLPAEQARAIMKYMQEQAGN
jgi:hypothetical protein